MSGIKVLDIVKPFASLIPEVELPYDKILFDEKMVYTIGVAVIYLLSFIPINGVIPSKIADPFYWLRLPFASEAGTLLEFGVLPVVTSAFFWQILSGFKIIKVNFNNIQDRENFQSLQKISAILLAVFYASILAVAGYFQPIDAFAHSDVYTTSIWSNLLIISQLGTVTGIVALMVEILEKGYGFGPGVMVCIAATTSTKLSGSLFGFLTNTITSQSEGTVIQLFRSIFSGSITSSIYNLFTRSEETNLTQIYLVIIALAAVAYLQNFRMDVSIKSAKVRSMMSSYPIRFLYCGALPILFAYTILYNVNIVAFAFTKIFGGLPLLAKWELDPLTNSTYELTSGFLYFLSPSQAGCCFILTVIRFVSFSLLITVLSTLFGRFWFNMSGSNGKDLAKQFKDQDIVVVGHRDATVAKELNKLISSASLTGSFALGAIISIIEATGVPKGFVAGVSVGVLSGLTLLEQIMTDYQQTGATNSQFAQVFGTN